MFIPFEALPDHSRIWIYQADRKLISHELNIISETLLSFTESWSVHGTPMQASFDIRFDQFIILAVDEISTGVSGCSIDGSVRVIKDLGQQLGIDFFDRTRVGLVVDNKIVSVHTNELGTLHRDGFWNEDTKVTNNLIGSKGDLASMWLVPAKLTWLKRYLPKETIVR